MYCMYLILFKNKCDKVKYFFFNKNCVFWFFECVKIVVSYI